MIDEPVRLNDGYQMPRLGLGVWQARTGLETERAVSAALQAGYRLIDTAAAYGNERSVGRAVAQSAVPRSELFITTKLWNADQGYSRTLRACRKSLQRLNLSYIDLYLIHWPLPHAGRYQETWRALEQLKREGLVRSIGVSNFTIEQMNNLLMHSEVQPAVNQVEVNPQFQQIPLREFCYSHSIVVESWSPLGAGTLLTNPTILEIAAKHEREPAQVIIRWHLQNNLVTIPKSTHPERIAKNYAVIDFALDSDDMAKISLLDSGARIGANPMKLATTLPTWLVQLAHRFRLVHW